MSLPKIVFFVVAGLMVLNSLIALGMYFADKKKAIQGKERTKEKHLLFISIFYGAIGALIGRILAHHKTDKVYFSIVIYLGLVLQVATLGALFAIAFII